MLYKQQTLKMKLTETVIRNFLVAKIFRENTDRINSLDYSSNGETLISSSDDDSIIIYDCNNGTWVDIMSATGKMWLSRGKMRMLLRVLTLNLSPNAALVEICTSLCCL